jgi:hypothetical protein
MDYLIAKKYLSSVFSLLSELLLVENSKLHLFAQKTFELIFVKTINENLSNEEISFFMPLQIEESQGKNIELKKLVAVLKYMLSTRFQGVRGRVMAIIGAFFERVGEGIFEYVKEVLIDLKETNRYKTQNSFLLII